MRKLRLLILGFTLNGSLIINAQSEFGTPPELNWLVEFGQDSSSHIISSTVDSESNVYSFAYAGDAFTFLNEEVEPGLVVFKQNGAGELQWLTQFNGAYADIPITGNNICLSQNEDKIAIAADFDGEITLPDGSNISAVSSGSLLIINMDSDGAYLSNIVEDISIGYDELSLVMDSQENIIISTHFYNVIEIADSVLIPDQGDGLILKYGSNGVLEWFQTIKGNSVNYSVYATVDNSDEIYLISEDNSDTAYIGDLIQPMLEGDGNILLVKLNSNGIAQWSKLLGASNDIIIDYYGWPTDIIFDGIDHFYIKGWHGSYSIFDDVEINSDYTWNKFIARIDSEGSVDWLYSIQEASLARDYMHFSSDDEGNVYSGHERVKDSLFFGDDFIYIPSGQPASLITSYSVDGTLNWVKEIKSDTLNVDLNSVLVADSNQVFITGTYRDSMLFANDEFYSLNRKGFIALLGDFTIGVEEIFSQDAIKLYPNPSNGWITIDTDKKIERIRVLNMKGQIVYSGQFQEQLNLQYLPCGSYILEAISEKGIFKERLLIQ